MSFGRFAWFLLVVPAAAGGCKPVSITFVGGSGGSTTTTGTTTTSSNCVPRDVAGTETITFLAPRMDVQPDLTMATVSALAGPKFQTVMGTGAPNGVFTLPAVPCGPYYLQLQDPGVTTAAPVFYLTSDDKVDMSKPVAGRFDAVPITKSSTVALTVSGLTTWAAGDSFSLVSPGAGLTANSIPVPPAGATAFMTSFDALNAFSPPNLVDTTKGDDLFVDQLVSTMQSGIATTVVGKSTDLMVTMTDGLPTNSMAALSAVPQTSSVTINWAVTAFESLMASVNPTATVASDAYFLTAHAGQPSDGFSSVEPLLLGFQAAPGADVKGLMLNYGDPFPATALYIAERVTTTFSVPVALTGATPFTFNLVADYIADQPTFDALTAVAPVITPPGNVMVDGSAAFGGGMLKSGTPTISFDAAAGTPSGYAVFVHQLAVVNGATQDTFLGSVHFKDTSVVIPPALLNGSGSYVFIVDAFAHPGLTIDSEATPRKGGFPYGLAETITGVFTL